MAELRIATWNLERPRQNSYIKNPRRIEKIRNVNADLWVLTETSSAITIDGYDSLTSGRDDDFHAPGENYSTIWSRWPILRRIETFDPSFTVCAEIDTPAEPMIVYGTIITYKNDRGSDGKARPWEEHRKSIQEHDADWYRLRKEFPDHLFCIAGDFNQSRDGSGWYEDKESVKRLSCALERNQLVCVTEDDLRAKGILRSRATIDHICLSRSLIKKVVSFNAWEGTNNDGCRMSDHNGVVIDIIT